MSNPQSPSGKPRDHTFSYKKYRQIDEAIRQENRRILEPLVTEAPTEEDKAIFQEPPTGDQRPPKARRVNLSGDPLISVLIRRHNKSDLAVELVKNTTVDILLGENFEGDTALHVAAAEGDMTVARAMLDWAKEWCRAKELVEAKNEKGEIPLHKAVLYGKAEMFWMLVDKYGSNVHARGEEGANILHYAIMCGQFELALEIAERYEDLALRRNTAAVTPLQLLVTAPEAFRSTRELGSLDALIYDFIPVEERMPTQHRGDEEAPERSSSHRMKPVGAVQLVEGQQFVFTSPRKYPSNYATIIDLLKLTCIPVKWVRLLAFNILKRLFGRVEHLAELKKNHKQVMKLISCLAACEGFWEFFHRGKKPEDGEASGQLGGNKSQGMTDSHLADAPPSFPPNQEEKETRKEGDSKDSSGRRWDEPSTLGAIVDVVSQILKMCRKSAGDFKDSGGFQRNDSPLTPDEMRLHELVSQILKICRESAGDSKDSSGARWADSPLIVGARMGLHEFVRQILKVCPESANYTDQEGQNVLQVAIQNGHVKIVDIVESLARKGNPVLPSWLLSNRESRTNNTILHFAAETTVKGWSPALQVQSELQWFERVKNLVPKDLWNRRNKEEKTAQELFTENHKTMVSESRNQLRDIGTACSGILAAVVFATSVSIPQNADVQELRKTAAFKVLPHAYEIGLSCAATSLVLFISLLTASYKEQDFRRSLPTMYFFAMTSFFMAMLCLLVVFFCNIYIGIYGGKGRLLIPAGELIAVPVICFVALFCRGCSFGIKSFFRNVWR